MIEINCYIPNKLSEVSAYVLAIIEQRLEVKFTINVHQENNYKFAYSGRSIKLPASFIYAEHDCFLEKRKEFNYKIDSVRYEKRRFYHIRPEVIDVKLQDEPFSLNIDLLGTIFIMLSRYEEYVLNSSHFDHFGRFKATSSVNFSKLNTPIVDELLLLFSNLIKTKLKVEIITKNSDFSILPTHDVDRPFEYLYYSPYKFMKRISGDLLQRNSISMAKKRWSIYQKVKKGDLHADPYNTFDWIMSTSEQYGLSSSFHFIPQATVPKKDQSYDLRDKEIKELLLEIHQRGHSIELHPSFGSSLISGQLSKEAKKLRNLCNELDIPITSLKSRYHYLRWNSESLQELEKADIKIDQTLGYAEHPGFRCGTCHPYKGFNFQRMEASSVIIEPLVLMEVSLFSDVYLGLNNDLEAAWEIAEKLKDQCKKHDGNFTILWHNNHLVEESMKYFYEQCIST